MSKILFQAVNESNGIRVTTVVEQLDEFDPPAPDPEPEPAYKVATVISEKTVLYIEDGVNNAGNPTLRQPAQDDPRRKRIDNGQWVAVEPNRVQCDGGRYWRLLQDDDQFNALDIPPGKYYINPNHVEVK